MRSDLKTSPPPPPSELGEAAADKPQPKGKEKRPWSKPKIRIMEMIFTDGGFNANPDITEHMQPSLSARTGPTYRTS